MSQKRTNPLDNNLLFFQWGETQSDNDSPSQGSNLGYLQKSDPAPVPLSQAVKPSQPQDSRSVADLWAQSAKEPVKAKFPPEDNAASCHY